MATQRQTGVQGLCQQRIVILEWRTPSDTEPRTDQRQPHSLGDVACRNDCHLAVVFILDRDSASALVYVDDARRIKHTVVISLDRLAWRKL